VSPFFEENPAMSFSDHLPVHLHLRLSRRIQFLVWGKYAAFMLPLMAVILMRDARLLAFSIVWTAVLCIALIVALMCCAVCASFSWRICAASGALWPCLRRW
jgi:hypothetical protein